MLRRQPFFSFPLTYELLAGHGNSGISRLYAGIRNFNMLVVAGGGALLIGAPPGSI
jgi:hypothetical protein